MHNNIFVILYSVKVSKSVIKILNLPSFFPVIMVLL